MVNIILNQHDINIPYLVLNSLQILNRNIYEKIKKGINM